MDGVETNQVMGGLYIQRKRESGVFSFWIPAVSVPYFYFKFGSLVGIEFEHQQPCLFKGLINKVDTIVELRNVGA